MKRGELTIGAISAFLLYMIQIMFNFIIIALVFGNIFKIQGASEKLVKMMKYIPSVNSRGGTKIYAADCKGELKLNNVKFSYPTKKNVQILNDISLDINQNEVVAFVGPSGCGKSSIIALIERFYDPSSGNIEFSGMDLKQLDPKWYKS